jgi:hypothetical protein
MQLSFLFPWFGNQHICIQVLWFLCKTQWDACGMHIIGGTLVFLMPLITNVAILPYMIDLFSCLMTVNYTSGWQIRTSVVSPFAASYIYVLLASSVLTDLYRSLKNPCGSIHHKRTTKSDDKVS